MISKQILRKLISQKLKDADALISCNRYAAAVYIAGYALELTLKLKICKIFKFSLGFPEDKAEFVFYKNNLRSQRSMASTITQIRDIRNHDLDKLLFYSGSEYNIKLNYLDEWSLVFGWDPEMRYKVDKVLKKDAVNKINAIKILIQNIL